MLLLFIISLVNLGEIASEVAVSRALPFELGRGSTQNTEKPDIKNSYNLWESKDEGTFNKAHL